MVLGVWVLKEVSIRSLPVPVASSFQLVIEVLVIVFGLAFVDIRFGVCALASKRETVSRVAVGGFYLD